MLKVEKHEIKNLSICFFVLSSIWMGYWLGSIILETVLVKKFGVYYYPLATLLTVIVSYVCAFISFNLSHYLNIFKFLFLTLIFSAFILILSRLLTSQKIIEATNEKSFIIYFAIISSMIALNFIVTLSLAWTIIEKVFRPDQLKRLIYIFSSAAVIAAILSGILVQVVLFLGEIYDVIVVWGALCLISAGLIYRNYIKSFDFKFTQEKSFKTEGFFTVIHKELNYIFTNRISIVLLTARFFEAFVYILMMYQFLSEATQVFRTENELSSAIGFLNIFIYVMVISFHLIFKNSLIFKVGVFRSLIFLPLVGLGGFTLLLYKLNFLNSLIFRCLFPFTFFTIFLSSYQFTFNKFETNHRENIRMMGEAMFNLGVGFSSIFLIFLNQNYPHYTVISIVGLLICVPYLTVLWKGNQYSDEAVLENLSKKHSMATALESLESLDDDQVGAFLANILSDEKGQFEVHEKVKTLATISQLKNPKMLRTLLMLLYDERPEIRYAALEATETLFTKVNDNFFALSYLTEEIKRLLWTDPDEHVRSGAMQFCLTHCPTDQLNKMFSGIFTQESPQERLKAYKALKNIRNEYVDLWMLKGLNDSDPAIKSEALSFLQPFPEYKTLVEKTLFTLLTATNSREKFYGLKALVVNPTAQFKELVEKLLSDEYFYNQILSRIFLYMLIDQEKKNSLLKESIDLIMKNNLSEDEFDELASIFANMKDMQTVDDFLYKLAEEMKAHPELNAMSTFAKHLANRISFA